MKFSTDRGRLPAPLIGGKIRLAFQPICVGNGRFDKAEVLCRLEYGGALIMPNDFIPLAEQNGEIDDVTRGVLRELGRCARGALLSEISFSVNLSPVQLKRRDFARDFCAWAGENGLGGRLVLEITERVGYEAGGTVKENVLALRAAGYALALDDFGKGSSDLAKVAKLPVRFVKIDKMYVDRIEERPVERMLRSVIGYAASTGREVIAEGVETERQKQILERLRCDYFQGYLFSRPLFEEDFLGCAAARGPCAARAE